jgi:hypothetical protein
MLELYASTTNVHILPSANLTSLELSGSSCNASRAQMITLSAVFSASAGGRDLNSRRQSSPCEQKKPLVTEKDTLDLPLSLLLKDGKKNNKG